MQERRDEGDKGCRTGGMQERRDGEKGGMEKRRDGRRKGRRDGGKE